MGAIEGGKLSSGKDEIGMSLGFSAADYSAILLSLKVAVTATVLSLPFGFTAAYVMTYGRFRGRLVLMSS